MKKLTPKNGVIKTKLVEVLDTCSFQTCEASYRNVKKATRHKVKAKAWKHKAKAISSRPRPKNSVLRPRSHPWF